MNYKIAPSEDLSYILLKVVGEINGESAMKQNKEAHALGKELGINRYLVDVSQARNTDSVLGTYDFAYKDMQKAEGIDVHATVAMLVSLGDHSHDFVETVARNAGLKVTIFIDRDRAIQHLSHQ